MFGRGGGGGRQVCRFFLEGRCRFGDNCKNEHPAGQGNSQSQGGGGFGNRFNALDNSGGASNRSGGFGSGTLNQDSNPYNISGETIKLDLTTERPVWPLSAYGPGKNAPRQLIEGDVEQSPEEMRVRHYLAVAKGNPQESVQLEAQTAAKINEVIQKILADINGAVKYVIDGKDAHPNRLEMVNNGSNQQPPQQQNPFGAPAAGAASGFGQPSGLGQQTSAFGKPAFGQPAAAQQSAFGQPSTFGKPAQPGFGQPSAMGGGGGSAFGQPSQPGKSSAFGAPSALGGSGSAASAFGQPSAPGQSTGFGQPSALGGSGGATSAFGQPSAPGHSTGFGQPSQMGQKPAFGQSTFGQSSQPGFGKPAFGQASASGQQQSNASPFGAAASQSSGFAQAASQPSTGFGQPSAFGAATNKPSPFAAAGQNQQQQSPFGASPSNNQQQQKPNPFGGSSQPSAFGQPSQPAAQQNPFSTGGASTAPNPAFGQPTQPTPNAFGQQSQPAPALPTANKENKDIQLDDVYYTGDLGKELQAIYESVAAHGVFPGAMPEVPPKREWIKYET